jgi:hypothetical protein
VEPFRDGVIAIIILPDRLKMGLSRRGMSDGGERHADASHAVAEQTTCVVHADHPAWTKAISTQLAGRSVERSAVAASRFSRL